MPKGFKIAFTAFVVTAGLIKGAPTLAQPAKPELNVSYVHTADLDLSTAAGRQALDHRLVVAAREVCGTASDADLVGKNDVRKCRVQTLARAQADRDSVLAANHGTVIALAAAR
jgi:UrcA family protein